MARRDGTDRDDVLIGTTSDDVIYGYGGNDQIFGNSGRDLMYGGYGDDLISVQAHGSQAYGEEGNDTFSIVLRSGAGTQQTIIDGGDGDDYVNIRQGSSIDNLTLSGGIGNDRLMLSGASIVDVTEGLIRIGDYEGSFSSIENFRLGGDGELQSIIFTGSENSETVELFYDDAVAYGFAGDDVIYSSGLFSFIDAGTGNDIVTANVNNGIGEYYGGSGSDTLVVNGSTVNLTLDRSGNAIVANSGGSTASSSAIYGFENITAQGQTTYIAGNDKANTITGGYGKDTFLGGGGADTLNGGSQGDVLTGGGGADRFVYVGRDSSPSDRDLITDFSHNAGDKIDLTALGGFLVFVGKAAFSGTGGEGGNEGEVRFEKIGTNTLIQVDFNADRNSDLDIILSGNKALVASDFLI